MGCQQATAPSASQWSVLWVCAYVSAGLSWAQGRAANLYPAESHDSVEALDFAREKAKCLEQAEAAVLQAPDKQEQHVTTSRLFKRDLAAHFCGRAKQLTVLEIGIYMGHTTLVLAAIFGKVLAVDVETEYLEAAASHTRNQGNIVFIPFDSFTDDWHLIRSNKIDVVFIDGNHNYEKVRNDAVSSLSYLSATQLIFDDFGVEDPVRQVVTELQKADALVDCEPLGHGKDGRSWRLHDFGLVNHSEAIICSRGSTIKSGVEWARIDYPYFIYTVPADPLMRAEGVVRFTVKRTGELGRQARGHIWTSRWGSGSFRRIHPEWPLDENGRFRDAFNVSLPGLGPGRWEALFNRGRTAFIFSKEGTIEASWFGLRAEMVNHVFKVANYQFE